jgi:toxin ParE1/3/4
VPSVRYTKRAEMDLHAIGAYTIDRWGVEQCKRYLDELEACCQRLLDPTLGSVHHPRPQYLRIEQGRHVVFFRRTDDGDVVVLRILHDRMLPELHLTERDE